MDNMTKTPAATGQSRRAVRGFNLSPPVPPPPPPAPPSQSFDPDEIIVIEDCSAPNHPEISILTDADQRLSQENETRYSTPSIRAAHDDDVLIIGPSKKSAYHDQGPKQSGLEREQKYEYFERAINPYSINYVPGSQILTPPSSTSRKAIDEKPMNDSTKPCTIEIIHELPHSNETDLSRTHLEKLLKKYQEDFFVTQRLGNVIATKRSKYQALADQYAEQESEIKRARAMLERHIASIERLVDRAKDARYDYPFMGDLNSDSWSTSYPSVEIIDNHQDTDKIVWGEDDKSLHGSDVSEEKDTEESTIIDKAKEDDLDAMIDEILTNQKKPLPPKPTGKPKANAVAEQLLDENVVDACIHELRRAGKEQLAGKLEDSLWLNQLIHAPKPKSPTEAMNSAEKNSTKHAFVEEGSVAGDSDATCSPNVSLTEPAETISAVVDAVTAGPSVQPETSELKHRPTLSMISRDILFGDENEKDLSLPHRPDMLAGDAYNSPKHAETSLTKDITQPLGSHVSRNLRGPSQTGTEQFEKQSSFPGSFSYNNYSKFNPSPQNTQPAFGDSEVNLNSGDVAFPNARTSHALTAANGVQSGMFAGTKEPTIRPNNHSDLFPPLFPQSWGFMPYPPYGSGYNGPFIPQQNALAMAHPWGRAVVPDWRLETSERATSKAAEIPYPARYGAVQQGQDNTPVDEQLEAMLEEQFSRRAMLMQQYQSKSISDYDKRQASHIIPYQPKDFARAPVDAYITRDRTMTGGIAKCDEISAKISDLPQYLKGVKSSKQSEHLISAPVMDPARELDRIERQDIARMKAERQRQSAFFTEYAMNESDNKAADQDTEIEDDSTRTSDQNAKPGLATRSKSNETSSVRTTSPITNPSTASHDPPTSSLLTSTAPTASLPPATTDPTQTTSPFTLPLPPSLTTFFHFLQTSTLWEPSLTWTQHPRSDRPMHSSPSSPFAIENSSGALSWRPCPQDTPHHHNVDKGAQAKKALAEKSVRIFEYVAAVVAEMEGERGLAVSVQNEGRFGEGSVRWEPKTEGGEWWNEDQDVDEA